MLYKDINAIEKEPIKRERLKMHLGEEMIYGTLSLRKREGIGSRAQIKKLGREELGNVTCDGD